ncbi:MAG: DoxX family protein [Nitrococcus mobilis]|nr:DoxX family protein [Nitrococcus mobilis]
MDHVMTNAGKLILRVTLGLLVLLHGIHKLLNGVGGVEDMVVNAGLPWILAYGVFLGEIVGPILLIIGWYARIGALLIVMNMIFAFALAHMNMLFQLNAQGGWVLELQGMYLFTAITLALIGPGRFSINGR